MSAETPVPPHIWENTWRDSPHFSIWDGGLHHLTSQKQLRGFITRRVRASFHRVAPECNKKWDFSAVIGCVLEDQGGQSETFTCSWLIQSEGFNRLVAAFLTFRQLSVIHCVFSIHGITCKQTRCSRCSQWRSFLGQVLLARSKRLQQHLAL